MIKRAVYLAGLRLLLPAVDSLHGSGLDAKAEHALLRLLRRHRCLGGVLRLFDAGGTAAEYAFGQAGPGRPAEPGMAFRVASVSKMITAACVLKLAEQGLVDLDEDVNPALPYPLRHPGAPQQAITLRQLLSHTAAINDGQAYQQGIVTGAPASQVLAGDSFCSHLPGDRWSYSNLGAGLIACVLEGKLGKSFEAIMQETLFAPLGVAASFYPQRVTGPLADAARVLPPSRSPGFDAAQRRAKPLTGADQPDPERHYTLTQGNCCLTVQGLHILMEALVRPGFLRADTLTMMRRPVADFGQRSAHLKQGLGMFELNNPAISALPLYGHQGNAYGAVHAAFFEPRAGRGMIFLSYGASEARLAFLADIVADLLALFYGEGAWPRTA
ncbi:MAG: beta-lactamase family protein [Clostridiales bacterium]|nr:beta-lactamase family protein [Clostridiales bacterium]